MRMPQLNDNALNIEPTNLAQLLTLMDHLEYSSKCFAPIVFIMPFFTIIAPLQHCWYLPILDKAIWDTCGTLPYLSAVTQHAARLHLKLRRYIILIVIEHDITFCVNFRTKYWSIAWLRISPQLWFCWFTIEGSYSFNMENGAHFAWWWKTQWKIQTDEVK